MTGSPNWYVLQVRPKLDDRVAQSLAQKGYEPYSPSYAMPSPGGKSRLRKLFPGYVFCRFCYGSLNAGGGSGVVTTDGVVRLLGGRPPAPVPDHEIEGIVSVLGQELNVSPCDYLRAGQHCIIERGPLRGLSGIVLSRSGYCQLVLSIELLQRSVAVTIDPSWVGIEPAGLGEKLAGAVQLRSPNAAA